MPDSNELTNDAQRKETRRSVLRRISGREVPTFIEQVRAPSGTPYLLVVERWPRGPGVTDVQAASYVNLARASAGFQHANVVRSRAVTIRQDEIVVASDFVDGERLSELWRTLAARGSSLPMGIAARILIDILTGLDAFHAYKDPKGPTPKLLHGEVTASNVLVGADGVSRLLHAARIRRPGVLPADAGAIAPELVAGGAGDLRADIFGVGVLLWQALSGVAALSDAADAGLVTRIRTGKVERAPVPKDAPWAAPLVAVAARAMSIAPADRFASASAMSAELKKIAGRELPDASAVADFLRVNAGEKIEERRQRAQAAEAAQAHAAPAASPKTDAVPAAVKALAGKNANTTLLGMPPAKRPEPKESEGPVIPGPPPAPTAAVSPVAERAPSPPKPPPAPAKPAPASPAKAPPPPAATAPPAPKPPPAPAAPKPPPAPAAAKPAAPPAKPPAAAAPIPAKPAPAPAARAPAQPAAAKPAPVPAKPAPAAPPAKPAPAPAAAKPASPAKAPAAPPPLSPAPVAKAPGAPAVAKPAAAPPPLPPPPAPEPPPIATRSNVEPSRVVDIDSEAESIPPSGPRSEDRPTFPKLVDPVSLAVPPVTERPIPNEPKVVIASSKKEDEGQDIDLSTEPPSSKSGGAMLPDFAALVPGPPKAPTRARAETPAAAPVIAPAPAEPIAAPSAHRLLPSTDPAPPRKSGKGRAMLGMVVAIGLAIAGFAGFKMWQKQPETSDRSVAPSPPTPARDPAPAQVAKNPPAAPTPSPPPAVTALRPTTTATAQSTARAQQVPSPPPEPTTTRPADSDTEDDTSGARGQSPHAPRAPAVEPTPPAAPAPPPAPTRPKFDPKRI